MIGNSLSDKYDIGDKWDRCLHFDQALASSISLIVINTISCNLMSYYL